MYSPHEGMLHFLPVEAIQPFSPVQFFRARDDKLLCDPRGGVAVG